MLWSPRGKTAVVYTPSFFLQLLFSCSVVSDSLRPHELQYARLPCPSPFLRICSNSSPLSRWCHPTISHSVTLFSCPQSFPVSESFPMSLLFTLGDQRIRASTSPSVLPMNIQSWFLLGLIGLIFLLSKGLSRKSLLQHHNLKASILQHSAFFMAHLWLLGKP